MNCAAFQIHYNQSGKFAFALDVVYLHTIHSRFLRHRVRERKRESEKERTLQQPRIYISSLQRYTMQKDNLNIIYEFVYYTQNTGDCRKHARMHHQYYACVKIENYDHFI